MERISISDADFVKITTGEQSEARRYYEDFENTVKAGNVAIAVWDKGLDLQIEIVSAEQHIHTPYPSEIIKYQILRYEGEPVVQHHEIPRESKFKRLIFGEGLLDPVFAGDKRKTIRNYRAGSHDVEVGQVIAGEFKDGMQILLKITDPTIKKTFGEITDEEAQADGFADAADMMAGMRQWYPDLQPSNIAAQIFFEILQLNGVPVIQYNEFAQPDLDED